MSDELVRVRLDNGHELNVGRAFAESTKGVEILDEPAQETFGKPRPETRKGGRPILPVTTVDEEANKSQAAKPADTKKG